jgi:hypothetical protein
MKPKNMGLILFMSIMVMLLWTVTEIVKRIIEGLT